MARLGLRFSVLSSLWVDVDKHVQQVVNSVEVNQSEITKKTVQRKNPMIQEKINHVSKQKGELDPEPAHLTS